MAPEPTAVDDLPSPLLAAIRDAGQEHVLRFWPDLSGDSRAALLDQLRSIDWPGLAELRRLALAAGSAATAPGVGFDLEAADTPPCQRLGDARGARAVEAGRAALAEVLFGAVIVAGGQGSRLGCNGPKGAVAVGPVSGGSLFDILLGKLVGIRRRFGRPVPLAIMTSSSTESDTGAWLASHDHGGLDPDDVMVFRQHDLPALDDHDATLLLDAPDRIALAPDGHGGMLPALVGSGGLDWFAKRKVRHVVSFQVDNPLTMPFHPEFIGHHLLHDAELSTQVIRKQEPGERVGVVATTGGRTFVIEYSDLPPALAAERGADGRLRFHAGSIAVHAFALDFLRRAASSPAPLPLHLAHKAVPHLDSTGIRLVPREPNAIKFERFIFDLMPLARRVCVVEIDPAEGFAPLKNPPGAAADTLAHVQGAMISHARRVLARAGVDVAAGVTVELAPWILDESDVAAILPPGSRLGRDSVVGG